MAARAAETESATENEALHEVSEEMPNQAAVQEPISLANNLFTEEVQVEHIPVNRIVETRPGVRQEGDVTIVPVIEEVITVQKRLLLREEVRVTRTRVEN